MVNVGRPLALEIDPAAGLDKISIAEALPDTGGDVKRADGAMGFQAARHVHRVAPDIVDELVGADDAGDDGASMEADASCRGSSRFQLAWRADSSIARPISAAAAAWSPA